MAASARSSSSPPLTLSPTTSASASGTSSVPAGKLPAMPCRVLGKQGELSSSIQSVSDGIISDSSSARHHHTSSDGVSPAKCPSQSSPPASDGTPAAGSIHVDIAASSCSDTGTVHYDDQCEVEGQLAKPGVAVTAGKQTPAADELQQQQPQQQQQSKLAAATATTSSAATDHGHVGSGSYTSPGSGVQEHKQSNAAAAAVHTVTAAAAAGSVFVPPVLPVVSTEPSTRRRTTHREQRRPSGGVAASRSSSSCARAEPVYSRSRPSRF